MGGRWFTSGLIVVQRNTISLSRIFNLGGAPCTATCKHALHASALHASVAVFSAKKYSILWLPMATSLACLLLL